jgi:hypothetical protein
MKIAAYRSLQETSAHCVDWSWERVRAWLQDVREWHGDLEARKASCPLWSPVIMRAPRRANRNILAVTALVLDYDSGTDLDEAMDAWDGYERVGHTTWRHAPMEPRCRVVMPLASPISAAVWRPLHKAILQEHSLEADAVTCDPSRAYYLPSVGLHDCAQAWAESGEILDLSSRASEIEVKRRADLARVEAEAARSREAAARYIDDVGTAARHAARLFATDPDRRRMAAQLVGAELVEGLDAAGHIVRHAPCPKCSRASVWWAIHPTRARGVFCNHRNSCDFTLSLYDYIKEVGHAQ